MVTLIIGVILFVVGFALIFSKNASCRNYVAIILITIGYNCFHEYGLKTNPQAIDVYRNKTTLMITFKDSIPVDSVVVFNERR